MISGLVLKYLNGERLVIAQGYGTALPASSQVPLTVPIDVFMRNTVGAGFPATADLVSKYYMIAVSFLPVAYSELKRRQVEASIFTDRLPPRVQPAIFALGFLLSIAAYALLAWGTGSEALVQTQRRAYVEAGAILFYTWPGYWILPLSFGLMALVLMLRLYQVLTGGFVDMPVAPSPQAQE